MKKSVIVLDSGGRGSAIVRELAKSDLYYRVYLATGNSWANEYPEVILVPIKPEPDQFPALITFILEHDITLVVSGSEDPLINGITNVIEANNACALAGVVVIGPSREASLLEGKKSYAKNFMQRYNIPTAFAAVFTSANRAKGVRYIQQGTFPIVIKADGLALGKGVTVCYNAEDAVAEFNAMLDGKFGTASATVLVESFLKGVEFSLFIAIDKKGNYVVLPAAKDYKRLGNNDEGPNTGGMGAICPLPFVTPNLVKTIRKTIVEPTIRGMKKEGTPYVGFLYLGLMLVNGKPYVIEYNCRLGDPETQVVVANLGTQFSALIEAMAADGLADFTLVENPTYHVVVVAAAAGYPGNNVRKGDLIVVKDGADIVTLIAKGSLIGAGVTGNPFKGESVTSGGRVLGAVGVGDTPSEAIEDAYAILKNVSFDGMQYRTDIGADVVALATVDVQ